MLRREKLEIFLFATFTKRVVILLVAGLVLEFFDPCDNDRRVKAVFEVGIDKGEANSAPLVDQKGPWHWKFPRVIAVEGGQVRADPSVRSSHRLLDSED